MANNAGLQNILKLAIKNMGENEDNTEETDLSQRSAEDLAWLKEAVEAGAAGADVDVKGTLLVITFELKKLTVFKICWTR